MKINRLALALVWIFAGLCVAVLAAVQPAIAQQNDAAQRATIAVKIHKLTNDELRTFLHKHMYGGDAGEYKEEDVFMDFVFVDDVTVAGVSYPLIFVGSDDVLGWDVYSKFLPADVKKKPANEPNDEQVIEYVKKLTVVAENNYLSLFNKNFESNKAVYAKDYPQEWPEQTVRLSVQALYEYDQNAQKEPEIQRAYNEYAALRTLGEALDFYMKLKKEKL